VRCHSTLEHWRQHHAVATSRRKLRRTRQSTATAALWPSSRHNSSVMSSIRSYVFAATNSRSFSALKVLRTFGARQVDKRPNGTCQGIVISISHVVHNCLRHTFHGRRSSMLPRCYLELCFAASSHVEAFRERVFQYLRRRRIPGGLRCSSTGAKDSPQSPAPFSTRDQGVEGINFPIRHVRNQLQTTSRCVHSSRASTMTYECRHSRIMCMWAFMRSSVSGSCRLDWHAE
jgi:hypothetical protein